MESLSNLTPRQEGSLRSASVGAAEDLEFLPSPQKKTVSGKFYAAIALSDLNFILMGYLPLTICQSNGLKRAVQNLNSSMNASHPNGVFKPVGSIEHILENIFYHQCE